nr:16S rRNA (cytosine(967)-C(5))-methyltransferase RsmB [Oscillospiraceae bacterium]
MQSARLVACRLLERAEKGAYSNIALEAELSRSGLDERDRALAARLFYGVCERKITLEHLLGAHLSRPFDKLDVPVRNALTVGAYQLLYMDSVPD